MLKGPWPGDRTRPRTAGAAGARKSGTAGQRDSGTAGATATDISVSDSPHLPISPSPHLPVDVRPIAHSPTLALAISSRCRANGSCCGRTRAGPVDTALVAPPRALEVVQDFRVEADRNGDLPARRRQDQTRGRQLVPGPTGIVRILGRAALDLLVRHRAKPGPVGSTLLPLRDLSHDTLPAHSLWPSVPRRSGGAPGAACTPQRSQGRGSPRVVSSGPRRRDRSAPLEPACRRS